MKRCSKCNTEKPTTDFYVKDSASGRRHTQCKACYREYRTAYYAATYPLKQSEYQARAKLYREKLRTAFRENMLRYLHGRTCTICGEDDIRTFEFDHIDPQVKKFSISQATRLGYSWEDVKSEIKKCRILCANCHRKHTSQQVGWYKETIQ